MSEQEPVAWLVLDAKLEPFHVHRHKDPALRDANECSGIIFPLYRDPPPPTLTDEERQCLEEAIHRVAEHDNEPDGWKSYTADTLRGLLNRLGGDR